MVGEGFAVDGNELPYLALVESGYLEGCAIGLLRAGAGDEEQECQ